MMRRFWTRLWNSCWFSHHEDKLYDFDERGRLIWTCSRCQLPIGVVLPPPSHPFPLKFPDRLHRVKL